MSKKFAVTFPGQGSQSVGMLSDIRERYSIVDELFAEASAILSYDLWKIVSDNENHLLDKTEYTQPALLVSSYAIWKILFTETKIKPAFFAGHSLGEYTALLCANALTFETALSLVKARGQYMQEAFGENGSMAAIIGLDDATVESICAEVQKKNQIVSPANYNAVSQVVIAGEKDAVNQAIVYAKEKGAKLAVLLPVSVPSHCILMKDAAKKLAADLEKITLKTPEIPVISNVDVAPYDSNASTANLVRQLCSPVRWVETIKYFRKEGVSDIIECGPGKVLSGLTKRIDKDMEQWNTGNLANLENTITMIKEVCHS